MTARKNTTMLSVLEGYYQPGFGARHLRPESLHVVDTDETAGPGVKVMPTHGGVRADAIAVLLGPIIWKTGRVLGQNGRSAAIPSARFGDKHPRPETTVEVQTIPLKAHGHSRAHLTRLTDSHSTT